MKIAHIQSARATMHSFQKPNKFNIIFAEPVTSFLDNYYVNREILELYRNGSLSIPDRNQEQLYDAELNAHISSITTDAVIKTACPEYNKHTMKIINSFAKRHGANTGLPS